MPDTERAIQWRLHTRPSQYVNNTLKRFRLLVKQRELTYTIPELTALMRASFQGTAGFSVPSDREVELLEADPMFAKFGHIVLYGLMFTKHIRIDGSKNNQWMKKKKGITFFHDRSVLDRIIGGTMKLDRIVLYGRDDHGLKKYEICPVPGSEHGRAILSLLDLAYIEVLDLVAKEALDEA